MNALLGRPKVEGPELVQETFRATKPPGDFETAWSKFLHDGFAAHVAVARATGDVQCCAAGRSGETTLVGHAGCQLRESPEIVFVPQLFHG